MAIVPMKPRIKKISKPSSQSILWMCTSNSTVAFGIGATPEIAYEQYRKHVDKINDMYYSWYKSYY